MNNLSTRTPFWGTNTDERFAIRTSTREALLAAAPIASVPAVPTGPYNTMANWSRLDSDTKNVLPSSLWQIHEVLALSPSRSPLSSVGARQNPPLLPAPDQRLDEAVKEINHELDLLVSTSNDLVIDTLPIPKDSAVDLSNYNWSNILPITQASHPANPIDSIAPEVLEEEEQDPQRTKTHIFILQTHPSDPRTLSSRPPISIRHLAHLPSSGGSGNVWRKSEMFSDAENPYLDHLNIDLGDWGVPPGSARTWRSGAMHYPMVVDEPVVQQPQQEGRRRTRAKSMLRESVLRLRRLSRVESVR